VLTQPVLPSFNATADQSPACPVSRTPDPILTVNSTGELELAARRTFRVSAVTYIVRRSISGAVCVAGAELSAAAFSASGGLVVDGA
jgi:hypothetical protein